MKEGRHQRLLREEVEATSRLLFVPFLRPVATLHSLTIVKIGDRNWTCPPPSLPLSHRETGAGRKQAAI